MSAMHWLEALLLGGVEGLSEFLPISSTAHLMLTAHALGLPQSEFVKSFEIAIQSGAILAVLVLYWRSFLHVATIKKLIVAFVPTGIIGFALYPFIKELLVGNLSVALVALGVGGVALIVFEYFYKQRSAETADHLTYRQAFAVGLFQSIAVIPGVSRSAATIVGGLSLGLSRQTIVEFSFLLAVPTMLAATGYDLLKNAGSFAASDFSVLAVGFAASFAVALVAVTFLLKFIKTHDFTSFGIYRVLLAVLFFFVFF